MSGLASLAFIKLFPLGQADPTKKGRRQDLSELVASNHLMKYAEIDCTKEPDESHPNGYLYFPFAEHERFCFWSVDRIRRHRALGQCSVFLRQNPEEAALSMEELKAMAANGQLDSVISKMYSYTANVTGSDAYWSKRRRELEAIMQQKGLGTAFFTVSFADNHWYDLHRLMPNGSAEPKLRYQSTNANLHLADWYFSEKLRLFMKHFFGGVLDLEWFWYRFEWQSRTAIHAHGVVKLKNDPGIADLMIKVYAGRLMAQKLADPQYTANLSEQDVQEKQDLVEAGILAELKVLKYADTLLCACNTRSDPVNPFNAEVPVPHPCSSNVSSILNDGAAMDDFYERLANCVQRHVCRPDGYCKSKDGKCRFHFPFDLVSESRIVFEKIGNTDSVRAKIVLKRNDKYMNVHNRSMLEHWCANVDLQLILDHHAAMNYMVKYASKQERSGNTLQQVIKTIINKADVTDNAGSAFRSSIIRSIGHRDIGKGEASRILFSGHHCESSFNYVNVSLDLTVNEVFRNPTTGELETRPTLLTYFAKRHVYIEQNTYPNWNLDQPNFIEFCRHFTVVKGNLRNNPKPDKTIVLTFPVHRNSPTSATYHLFCRYSLIKFFPWTESSIPMLLDDNLVVRQWQDFRLTAAQELRQYFNLDEELQSRLDQAADDLQEEDNIENDNFNQLEWQQAVGMRPAGEQEVRSDLPVIDRSFPWLTSLQLHYTPHELACGSTWVVNHLTNGRDLGTDSTDLPFVSPSQLNRSQRMWFDMVVEALQSRKQLLLIVNGTAGTGKTFTISAISSAVPKEHIVRSAYTAKAAHLIRGETLHKIFQIPVEKGQGTKFGPLNGAKLAALQEKFRHVKIIIIDEYSMLSLTMLGKIDARLREAKGNNLFCGGLTVILVGDPAQLPPVAAPSLYSQSTAPFANEGRAAYLAFQSVIKLTEVRRQQVEDGDIDQQTFLDTLNSLREGNCSIDQWKFLQARNPEAIANFGTDFEDATYLFATNEAVNRRNYFKLPQLQMPITLLRSVNVPSSGKSKPSDQFRGLEVELYLAIGAQVTLTSNINTDVGLTNGARGTVVDIVYSKQPNVDLPDFIVVRWPDYTGPQFFSTTMNNGISTHNCIPIPAISIRSDDTRAVRIQFPLRLAYAMTVWKSQGETLGKTVVDIGPKETAGLTFVALSRVRHISDLAVLPFDYQRALKISTGDGLFARKMEERRLNMLCQVTQDQWFENNPE
jgi:hypothetical protein